MNLNLVCEPKSSRKNKKRGRNRFKKNEDAQLKRKVQEKRRKVEEEVPERNDDGIGDDDGNDAGVRSFETSFGTRKRPRKMELSGGHKPRFSEGASLHPRNRRRVNISSPRVLRLNVGRIDENMRTVIEIG